MLLGQMQHWIVAGMHSNKWDIAEGRGTLRNILAKNGQEMIQNSFKLLGPLLAHYNVKGGDGPAELFNVDWYRKEPKPKRRVYVGKYGIHTTPKGGDPPALYDWLINGFVFAQDDDLLWLDDNIVFLDQMIATEPRGAGWHITLNGYIYEYIVK